ncbi:MAG: DinB family protein, partial [Dehalococcoidia bacterium]|nr:DinB family protein [Dehalococcoidia bacterium]
MSSASTPSATATTAPATSAASRTSLWVTAWSKSASSSSCAAARAPSRASPSSSSRGSPHWSTAHPWLYSGGVSLTAEYRTQLVARLRATTADLSWAVRDLPGDQHHWTPDSAEWSIHEQVSHLVDMEERVYLPLLRWAAIPEML